MHPMRMSTSDSLPGAHGIHKRDGSLLRRKQEQWEKEKAEAAVWFPFGSPGGGAPNKKTPKNNPSSANNSPNVTLVAGAESPSLQPFNPSNSYYTNPNYVSQHQEQYNLNTSATQINPIPVNFHENLSRQTILPATPTYYFVNPGENNGIAAHNSPVLVQPSPPPLMRVTTPLPIPLIPASMPSTSTAAAAIPTYLPSVQSPSEQAHQQSFIYANTVYGHPIPVELVAGPNGQLVPKFPYAIPIQNMHQHHTQTSQFPTDPHHNNNSMNSSMSPPYLDPYGSLRRSKRENSFDDGKSSLPPINMNHSYMSNIDGSQNGQDFHPHDNSTRRNSLAEMAQNNQQIYDSMSSLASNGHRVYQQESDRKKREAIEIQNAIDEQLAEKKRIELLQAEQERKEAERIAREKAERDAQRRKESEQEQNKWKEKLTDQEARQKAMFEKLEEAKREAEALKKAKLYKHVLQGSESPQEVAQRLLGTPDTKEAQLVLKQVDDIEYRKRIEMEQLYSSSKPGSNEVKRSDTSGSLTSSSGRAKSLPPKPPGQHAAHNGDTNPTPLSRYSRGRQSLRSPSTKTVTPAKRSSSNDRPKKDGEEFDPPKNTPPQKSLSRERRSNQAPTSRPVSRHPNGHDASGNETKITNNDDRPLPTLAKRQNMNYEEPENRDSPEPENHIPPPPMPPPRNQKFSRSESVDKAVNTRFPDEYDVDKKPDYGYKGYTQNAIKLIADLPNENDSPKPSANHENSAKLIGLFEPVPTRASKRNMRQTSIETPTIVTHDISSPESSSPSLSAGYESSNSPPNGTLYGGSRKNSDINGAPEVNGLQKSKSAHKVRSNLASNFLGSNQSIDDPSSRPPASPFVRRLAETNSKKQIMDYLNSSEINHRKLSSPTMMRLQASNVSINAINGQESGENSENEHHLQSRSTTPKPFNCRTSQYRSLNLKRNKERQEEILKQLANLRMQLKDKQQQMERTWSTQSLAKSATTPNMAKTLNK